MVDKFQNSIRTSQRMTVMMMLLMNIHLGNMKGMNIGRGTMMVRRKGMIMVMKWKEKGMMMMMYSSGESTSSVHTILYGVAQHNTQSPHLVKYLEVVLL